MSSQDGQVVLGVVGIFGDAGVFQDGPQFVEDVAEGELGASTQRVLDRDVMGLALFHGYGDAHQVCGHGVGAGGLCVQSKGR